MELGMQVDYDRAGITDLVSPTCGWRAHALIPLILFGRAPRWSPLATTMWVGYGIFYGFWEMFPLCHRLAVPAHVVGVISAKFLMMMYDANVPVILALIGDLPLI
ncbi:hypothetical protein QBC38DRAFT_249592 [Podospora fimiseda]|uniref:Uncharacterized protein n=1 Tax=Podospora fimiseda TaxID=252190 RepID=A0AAN7GZX6_9PEZI|nr:hypothetical protein QBC38DRAFT_249592 [Podospora fimiseda]